MEHKVGRQHARERDGARFVRESRADDAAAADALGVQIAELQRGVDKVRGKNESLSRKLAESEQQLGQQLARVDEAKKRQDRHRAELETERQNTKQLVAARQALDAEKYPDCASRRSQAARSVSCKKGRVPVLRRTEAGTERCACVLERDEGLGATYENCTVSEGGRTSCALG